MALFNIEKFVDNFISIGITGILIIMGDPSQSKISDSGLIPSEVVLNLKKRDRKGIDTFYRVDKYKCTFVNLD